MVAVYKKTKLVQGVGINDADYAVDPVVNGKRVPCPIYKAWAGMLRRAYAEEYQARFPTYVGTKVVPEWLYFSNFKKWFEDKYEDGYVLDKDLIDEENKVYGPDNCVVVPEYMNLFILTNNGAKDNGLPQGVVRKKNKFQSRVNTPNGRKHLGSFNTPEEAHEAWKRAKLDLVEDMKEELDKVDDRLYPALVKRYA